MEKIKCNECQYFAINKNYEYCCYYCEYLSVLMGLEICAFTLGYDKEDEGEEQ